ncbi:MAG: ABC transporter ATP-binding protein [Candidatus Limiplasma sp.]|nr:ABC transporter ATP-binding protein [Candidatus Limiplasma sp.]
MKKLLIYLNGYRKESILGPLFKLLEALQELLVPLVVAAIIDVGIAQRDTGYILRMCLLLVLLGAVGLASAITAQYFAAKAATGFGKALRHALLRHIQRLNFAQLDKLGAGTLVTRMTSDMNLAQTGVNMTLRLLLRSPFIVIGATVMAFTVDAPTAGVFLAVIPVLAVVVSAIMLITLPLYQKVQARLDRVLVTTRENLTGVRVIRAFGMEAEETADFAERNSALTVMQKFVGRISALMNPMTYIIINAGVAWLIWRGAVRVDAGLITQGAVVALYNYMSQILVELIKLANLIITITRAVAGGNRIQSVLAVQPTLPSPEASPMEDAAAPAIVFDHVSLRYHPGGDAALTDISFAVPRGQTVGIIGGTGSGKSSLVSLVPRFYEVSGGQVRVQGADVRSYPLAQLRRKVGVVPQQAALFRGTIAENLRFGNPDATDAELWQALATAQATEVVQGKGGLQAEVEQGGRNLSGGQRQRLTIARALVKNPEILILDDSASALDYATDAALRKALRALPGGMTVLVVSQRAASIQFADQIIVLEDGHMAGIGASDALLKTCDVYREIYQSQFRKEDAPHA